ncbi:MAG: CotH kinase family protein, partial [Crocinitomicaceae bacterium]
ILNSGRVYCQDFFATDTIQKIEIQFSMTNWDYILDTAKAGSDSYTMAQWVKINGVLFDSVGVKYKGNSSYNANNEKNPLHIELNHFKSQNYMGYKDIKLSNGWRDPSFVREALTYKILQNYMHAPKANFAQVYVNGLYIGLYTNTEAVNKGFLESHFLSNDHTFVYADLGGCNLVFNGNDSTQYYAPYTLKSEYGYTDLKNLCDSLQNNIAGIENILDVDRALWMFAITNAFVILDSYIGGPQHNFYLYEDHNGRFNSIVWDLNGSFGTFSNFGMGSNLTLTQKQTLPVIIHENDANWPLIKQLMAIPLFKRMYVAHIRTVADEIISNSSYYTMAQELQSVIDTAYQSDVNAFFTYTQFLNNLTSNVSSGPSPIPGITNLMNARNSFLYSSSEFQQIQPTISNIVPSNNFPQINSSIYITANVTGATAVFCGRRGSEMEKFTRIQMYDNGLNGDGAAGDGVYGAAVYVSSPEIQYYIYAENNNAGIFSPQRAEHEWYTIEVDYATIASGQLVINEFSALNGTIQANGFGSYNDWIEVHNTTSTTINLDNVFISDDYTNPSKWQFPTGTIIPPSGYLIVWCDNDVFFGELHSGFGLSSNGEEVILSYANGTIIDSTTFPLQSTDISYGRYPNGTGPFVFMEPTFNAVNLVADLPNDPEASGFKIYPNPFTTQATLISDKPMVDATLTIFNICGQQVNEIKNINEQTVSIKRDSLPSGIYFVRVSQGNGLISTVKICITD